MDINKQQRRLFTSLVLLLIFAFSGTISLSYFVARNAIRKNIIQNELPLTGDSIYSEIQRDLIKPVFVSDLMAHNTFFLDWIERGEKDPEEIFRYLTEIQRRYKAVTSFYVSEQTRRYFNPDKIDNTVSEANERDRWFFRVRAMKEAYEINIDTDTRNNDRLTAFINFRIVDASGRFLGATGVGLSSDAIFKLVEDYKLKFNRDVEFFDLAGNSTVYDPRRKMRGTALRNRPGIKLIASSILNQSMVQTKLSYQNVDGSFTYVNSRYVPELKWYLVVSQNEKESLQPLSQVLLLNLIIGTLATLGALGLTLWLVSRYQRRLINVAVTDKLTGIANRSSGDARFTQVRKDAIASNHPFSVMVIDCDHFKKVNDEYGHLVGDRVIAELAQLICKNIRSSDFLTRWGGEEFMVLFPNANRSGAEMRAEALRIAVENHRFMANRQPFQKTISIGVAEWDRSESNDALFARADRALLLSKQLGRNRVTVAERDAKDLTEVS